jgi:hypothetical protein
MGKEEAANDARQRGGQYVVKELGEEAPQQRRIVSHHPVVLRPAFFKRAVEFQTSVIGGRRPGKRNFCGKPGDLLRKDQI